MTESYWTMSKTDKDKIAAFKKIYEILHELHNNPAKTNFMADKKERRYEELFVDLVNYCAKKKEGHTAKAWELSQKYYHDFTSNNSTLVEEMVAFTKKNNWFSSFTFYNQEDQIREQIIKKLDDGFFIMSTPQKTLTS